MKNKPDFKWYVVDMQKMCIDSGHRDVGDANQRAMDLRKAGAAALGVKVMTKPRIGALVLDAKDDASWKPKRENPRLNPYVAAKGNWDSEYRRHQWNADSIRVYKNKDDADRYAATEQADEYFDEAEVFERDLIENPRRKNRARDTAKGLKENPGELLVVNGESDSKKAEAVYELWHQKEPSRVSVLKTGCDGQDRMVCVGAAHNIVYRSGKWQKGRKTEDYVHHFDSKPKVWMLAHLVEDGLGSAGEKCVDDLLKGTHNAEGRVATAELATPLSFGLDDGTSEGADIAIHSGARVYGAINKKTLIITDPHWKLIVIKGGQMYFDERGIVK